MRKALTLTVFLLGALALARSVFSAGSCTAPVLFTKEGTMVQYDVAWTADASGDVDDNTCIVTFTGFLTEVVFISESTLSPSENYDVRLLDEWGNDVLDDAGQNIASYTLADRDQDTWYRSPQNVDAGFHQFINEPLEVFVQNAGNVKKGTVRLNGVRP